MIEDMIGYMDSKSAEHKEFLKRVATNTGRKKELKNISSRKFEEIFDKNLGKLKSVGEGKIESKTHNLFYGSLADRRSLTFMSPVSVYTDEQLDLMSCLLDKVLTS